MYLIIGIPALIALYVCVRRGAADSFLNVYLPFLLLLPDAFRWPLSGQLSFHQSAVLPIALFYLMTSWRDWKWGVADLLVAVMVGIMCFAEYVDHDFHEARNVAIHTTLTVVFPYVLAKGLLKNEALWTASAKRIAVFAAVVSIMGVFELATGRNLFIDPFTPFFPKFPYRPDQTRFGLTRPAGPYGHAILAGIVLAVSYRFAKWLDWNKLWPDADRSCITRVRNCELLIVAGSIMTLSRGPWIAAGLAAIIVSLSRLQKRRRALVLAGAIAVFASFPAYYFSSLYVSSGPGMPTTEMRSSATYRYDMTRKYVSLVRQRPIWGWGRGGFPRFPRLASIDNQYLFLALNYGLLVASLLPMVILWSSSRLFASGMQLPRDAPITSLMFTLLGVQVVVAVSIMLSWLGGQTEPLLFLILGWSESVLRAASSKPALE